MQDSTDELLSLSAYMGDVTDLFVTNNHGYLRLFDSSDEADEYREEYAIDGQIIEIPFY